MKPPILSDEQITKAYGTDEVWRLSWAGVRDIATAQQDADAVYYEPLIEQAQEKIDCINIRQKAIEQKLDDVELAIQQAKAEVAREILEVYDRYIKLLGEEIDTLSPLAIAHGWSSVRFEAGNKCRADIQAVQSKYTGGKKC